MILTHIYLWTLVIIEKRYFIVMAVGNRERKRRKKCVNKYT